MSNQKESIIMEIRAGTGGDEAALFALDLFRMYTKYAQNQEWKSRILDSHATDIGGFKQVVFELKGKDVFSNLKYEGGVHRVQRVPKTEKAGRIHTSTATVAVFQKPKETDQIKIRPEDLKIETFRASGAGGQYVNKRETAIRITHLPTGTVTTSQTERNQLRNKENAMSIMKAKLFEKQETQDLEKLGKERKAQVGWARRVEKVRTYNFPQDRITDHRIKKSWHNLEKIMAGKLDPIVKTFKKKESKN